MLKRLVPIVCALAVVVGACVTSNAGPASASSRIQTVTAATKKCHFVTKKVHGKKKKVKVCRSVKPRPTPTATLAPVTPPAPHITATIPCSCDGGMTFAFGSLWINRGAFSHGDTVTRVDPATNQVIATVKVDALGGELIAAGFGSVWEVDFGSATVSRIDPQTNTVTAVIATKGTSPYGLAISPQAVWVANHNEPPIPNGANVAKIDPTANSVVDTVPVGGVNGGPGILLSAAGSIWAFDQVQGTIDRIDPTTDKVVAAVTAPGGRSIQHLFAGDDTHVWVSVPAEGTIHPEVDRINPATNAVTTAVPYSALAHYGVRNIYGLLFAGGSLWLNGPCGQQACLLRIDPDTGTVVAAWAMPSGDPTDPGFGGFVYAAGSMWVAAGTPDAPELLRLDVSSQ